LENEISEEMKKTEELQSWLQDISKDIRSDKTENANGRVANLVDQYRQLKKELQQLGMRHGEIVTYVEWLDKELKRERAKRVAHDKKYKAWEEKRELLAHIGDSINLKLTEIVEFNHKGLESLNLLISQLKPRQSSRHDTTSGSDVSALPTGSGTRSPRQGTSKHPGSSKRSTRTTIDVTTLPVLTKKSIRSGSSKRSMSPGSSRARPGLPKRAAAPGSSLPGVRRTGGSSKQLEVLEGQLNEEKYTLSEQSTAHLEVDGFGSLDQVKEGMLKMKEKKSNINILQHLPSGVTVYPTKNVGRTQSEGIYVSWGEVLSVPLSLKDKDAQNPRTLVATARRVKSTKIPERRAM